MKKRYIFISVLITIFIACNNESNNTQQEFKIKKDNIANNTDEKLPGSVKKRLSGMNIDVPEELVEISKEKIMQKYPGANRPDVVYSNADMSVNLNYSITKKTLKASDLKEYLTRTTSAIAQSIGKDNISQSLMDTINGREFAVIEFYSPSPSGRIYNQLLTTSVNDRMVIFSFNCTEEQIKEWEEDIPEIFHTITFN